MYDNEKENNPGTSMYIYAITNNWNDHKFSLMG